MENENLNVNIDNNPKMNNIVPIMFEEITVEDTFLFIKKINDELENDSKTKESLNNANIDNNYFNIGKCYRRIGHKYTFFSVIL